MINFVQHWDRGINISISEAEILTYLDSSDELVGSVFTNNNGDSVSLTEKGIQIEWYNQTRTALIPCVEYTVTTISDLTRWNEYTFTLPANTSTISPRPSSAPSPTFPYKRCHGAIEYNDDEVYGSCSTYHCSSSGTRCFKCDGNYVCAEDFREAMLGSTNCQSCTGSNPTPAPAPETGWNPRSNGRTQIWDVYDHADERFFNRQDDRLYKGGAKTWYPHNVEADNPHYMNICQSASSNNDCWYYQYDGKIATNVNISGDGDDRYKFAFIEQLDDRGGLSYKIKNKFYETYLCEDDNYYDSHIQECELFQRPIGVNMRQW